MADGDFSFGTSNLGALAGLTKKADKDVPTRPEPDADAKDPVETPATSPPVQDAPAPDEAAAAEAPARKPRSRRRKKAEVEPVAEPVARTREPRDREQQRGMFLADVPHAQQMRIKRLKLEYEEATGQRITSSEIVLAALSLLPEDPEAIRELLDA